VLRHRGRVLVVGAELGGHEPVLAAHEDVIG